MSVCMPVANSHRGFGIMIMLMVGIVFMRVIMLQSLMPVFMTMLFGQM
jgi:hypothetical protein